MSAKEKIVWKADGKNPGIKRAYTADGKPQARWQVVLELGMDPRTGKRRRSTRNVNSLAEAKRLKAKNVAERETGDVCTPAAKHLTFENLFDDFFFEIADTIRPNTLADYENQAKKISLYFQQQDIRTITSADMSRFFSVCLEGGKDDPKGRSQKEAKPEAVAFAHRPRGRQGCLPTQKFAHYKGVEASTLTALKRFLGRVCAFAKKHKDIYGNPDNLVAVLQDSCSAPVQKERVVLSFEQVSALLTEIFRTEPKRHLCAFLAIAAFTGMRSGEICGLQWKDILWSEGKIWICRQRLRNEIGQREETAPLKTAKKRKGITGEVGWDARRAALPDTLKQILLAYYRYNDAKGLPTGKDDFVICAWSNAGGHKHVQYAIPERISSSFNRIQQRVARTYTDKPDECPIPFHIAQNAAMRVHDWRHTYTTLLRSQTKAFSQIELSLGHKSGSNVEARVYDHTSELGLEDFSWIISTLNTNIQIDADFNETFGCRVPKPDPRVFPPGYPQEDALDAFADWVHDHKAAVKEMH